MKAEVALIAIAIFATIFGVIMFILIVDPAKDGEVVYSDEEITCRDWRSEVICNDRATNEETCRYDSSRSQHVPNGCWNDPEAT